MKSLSDITKKIFLDSKTRRQVCRVFSVALGFFFGAAVSVSAEESGEQVLSLSGFATLGVARSNSDQVEFVRDLSQGVGLKRKANASVDSLAGLQANWKISPAVEGVVQVVSRMRNANSWTPEPTWAYLRYDFHPEWSLRVGRLGTDFYLFSDSRLVGYSSLTVRPSVEFFTHLPFYSINGFDLAYTVPVEQGVLKTKVFAGTSTDRLMWGESTWAMRGSNMFGVSAEYSLPNWILKANFSTIELGNDLPVANLLNRFLPQSEAKQAMSLLKAEGTRANYFALGAAYEAGPWQAQVMVNQIAQESHAFESSKVFYGQVGYRIKDWIPFVGYARAFSHERARTGVGFTDWILQQSHVNQSTLTAGLRWDIARNWAVKAQYDWIDARRSSIFPFRNEQDGWGGRLGVATLTLDMVF